jgi:hypothetical protein
MLAAGVIRKSKSEWASPPVFVKKKDGSLRLCIDYRRVNRQLEADSYPIPLLLDGLEQVAHHKMFITLDLQAGFWNVPLSEESKAVTAFITPQGLFEFNVLPFGMKTSPALFQRAMDGIFGNLYGKGVYVYFDDIVVYGDEIDKVLQLFEEVLHRCETEGLTLRIDKSQFIQPIITFLGHLIGGHGISQDPKKVEAIRRARAPKEKGELRSFLGAIGFLRRFTPFFAEVTAVLSELLRKNSTWKWTEEHQAAFDNAKIMLSEEIMLSAPKGDGAFAVVTDASNQAIGAALLQVQGSELAVLRFASKKFTKAEQVWDVREKEAFAIKWAMQQFRDYVITGKTVVLTDHESLRWMDKAESGKVQRWALYL